MKKLYIAIFLLPLFAGLQAQDSLYLVNTLIGDTLNKLYHAQRAGDINGDGYDDIAVSYWWFIENYESMFTTHIYFGNPDFELEPDLSIYRGISFPGDVNNDGYDDFVFIKRKWNYDFKTDKIYLGYGGTNIDTAGRLVYEDQYWDEVFEYVEPLGDVNGDGYNDFAISSSYNWSNGLGFVYLYLGGDTVSNEPFVTFVQPSGGMGAFGRSVTGIGDVNNDGYDDIMVGEPRYADTIGAVSSGRVFLYHGGVNMDAVADTILTFHDIGFGGNIKNLGDLNNDGTKDFAITSDDSCVIYFSFENKITTRFYGRGIGHGIGGNGDINNDGISDLILGYRKGEDVKGMECYTGENPFYFTPDFYANLEQKYSSYGRYTDFIGDFNGDGYDDIYVVAPTFRENEQEIGKLYVYSYKNHTAIETIERPVIRDFELLPNYPNPFNPATTIAYTLNKTGFVRLIIYDITGKEVKTLISKEQPNGRYRIIWDGHNNRGKEVSSGVYLYRLSTDRLCQGRKMILIR